MYYYSRKRRAAIGFYNLIATYPVTLGAGKSDGITLNADGATYATSSNAIKVEIDRDAETCVTTKKVAGVETELDSSAITYGDAKVLIAIHDSDNLLSVFYDSALVYSGTVSDASIINNKKHYVATGEGSGAFSVERLRLGSELVTNGTMEADANWANYQTPTTNERSSTQKHTGSYSRKFVSNSISDGIQSDAFSSVAEEIYKVDFWVYPDDTTTVGYFFQKGDGSNNSFFGTVTGLTQDAWNHVTVYGIEAVGGVSSTIAIGDRAAATGTWYIDDVSVKKVNP